MCSVDFFIILLFFGETKRMRAVREGWKGGGRGRVVVVPYERLEGEGGGGWYGRV